MTPIIFIIGILTMLIMALILITVVNYNPQDWDSRTKGSQHHEFNNFMKRAKLYSNKVRGTNLA